MTGHRDNHNELPPRRKLHPSYRGAWTKRFYVTLVVLFASLIVFLITWFSLYSM